MTAAARAAGHPALVAPPAMLQAWTMPPLRPELGEEQLWTPLRRLLLADGNEAVVATGYEQTYVRYLTLGDRITETTAVTRCRSGRKPRWVAAILSPSVIAMAES